MKVTLLNAEHLKNLYKEHGMFACTCYDTPEKFAERVGKSCNESGHMSGSRTEYFKFRIEGIDRGVAEQFMRHEIGVRYDEIDKYQSYDNLECLIDVNPSNIVKNMQSFRYVDKNKFEYATPRNIQKIPDINKRYQSLMQHIDDEKQAICNMLIENGVDKKEAIEDANYALPRATTLTLTIAFTPEALIHFMHKRLCVRSQDLNTLFAREMRKRVKEVLPDFAKHLQPHCQYLLWCPEGKHTCGAYPTKDELKTLLNESK